MIMGVSSKGKLILGAIVLLIVIIFIVWLNYTMQNDEKDSNVQIIDKVSIQEIANQKRSEINVLMEQWELEDSNNSSSANPIDYMNTQASGSLFNLGVEYIPYLVERIKMENNKFTYGLTAAIIHISNAKEAHRFNYKSTTEFIKLWKGYEKSIPEKYKVMKGRDVTSELIQEVADLGSPILPLIIEDIETNDDLRFTLAISRILQSKETPGDNKLKSWKNWAKNKGNKYKVLEAVAKQANVESTPFEKRIEINNLIQDWLVESSGPGMGKSSNPYDYTHTPAFEKLSNLSVDYLPYLVAEAQEDEGSMTSFVLTIIIKKLSKAKEVQDFNYETANEFIMKWKHYERSVSDKYEKIKDRGEESAKLLQEVVDLGAPVLPLIIEDIESNDVRFALAITRILEDEDTPGDNKLKSWKIWATEKGSKYKAVKAADDGF